MILSDAVLRIADDSNVNSTITTVNSRIIREINRCCSEMWDGYAWSFRWRNLPLVTDTDYTTGTVTATNGSRTITGAGTTFLSSHKSWHVNFPADSVANWYKVRAFTSTSQLELDSPYQGTTASGKSYILRHFDYVLPTEIWDLGNVTVTNDSRTCQIMEPGSIEIVGPVPFYKGFPLAVAFYNSDSAPTVYSTGTVSGTINTTTLTGSGTSWLANIYPGDLVTISTYVYTVYSVDSDTQITLYNQQQAASSGATYTITRQFGRIMRVMWPSTDHYVLDIRYLRKYAPLVNNNDTNEILYRYPDTIVKKVSALELSGKGDVRARNLDQEATRLIYQARSDDATLTPKTNIASIHSYRMGVTRDNREVFR